VNLMPTKKFEESLRKLEQEFPPIEKDGGEQKAFLNEADQAYGALLKLQTQGMSPTHRIYQLTVTSFVLNFQNALINADRSQNTSFFNANKEKISNLNGKLDSLKISITDESLEKAIDEIDSIMLKQLPPSSIPTLPTIDRQPGGRKSPKVSKETEEFMRFLPANIDSIKNNFLSDEGWRTFRMLHGDAAFKNHIDLFLERLNKALQTAKDDKDSDFLIKYKDTLDRCQECLKGINDKLQLPAEQLKREYGVDKDNPRSRTSNWESLITNINAKIAERPDNKPKVSKETEEFMRFLPANIDSIKKNFLSDEGWRTFRMLHGDAGFKNHIDPFLERLNKALQTAKDDKDSDFLIKYKDTLDRCQECLKGINDKLQLPAEQLKREYGVDKDNPRSRTSNWESLITNINAKIAERPEDSKPDRRRPMR